MKQAPLFSIIIPCFNSSLYLKECLESLRVMEEKFLIEILCVDDNSTDNTVAILESYSNLFRSLRIFKNPLRGPGAARNFGIRNSSGSYLLFLDSDDYFSPSLASELGKVEVYKFDSILFGHNLFEEHSKIVIASSNVKSGSVKSFLRGRVAPAAWGKIISKDILVKNQIWFREDVKVEDVDFVLKVLFYSKKIKTLNGLHYNWRQRSLSESRTLDEKYIVDYFICISEIYSFLASTPNFSRKYYKSLVIFFYAFLANLFQKLIYCSVHERQNNIRLIETHYNNLNESLKNPSALLLSRPDLYRAIFYNKEVDLPSPKIKPILYFRMILYPGFVILVIKAVLRRIKTSKV